MKKVAIILSVYNGEHYLAEQLDSIVNQTYKNMEVYIHDDISNDNTLKIVDKYIKNELSKIKFTLHSRSKLGYPQCFITPLLEIEQADYYAFCDQDDIWLPDKIERAVRSLEEYGDDDEPCLYYSCVDYYDKDLNFVRGARFIKKKNTIARYGLQEMLLGGEAMGMTYLFNNKVRDALKESNKDNMLNFKDLYIKILCASCGKVIYSTYPCAKYRRHNGATTSKENPGNIVNRYFAVFKKVILEPDGLNGIQEIIDYITKKYNDQILLENRKLLELFRSPRTIKKALTKFFWTRRFRCRFIDELGYRWAFLMLHI